MVSGFLKYFAISGSFRLDRKPYSLPGIPVSWKIIGSPISHNEYFSGFGFEDEDSMVEFLTGANGTASDVLGGVVFSSLDPGKLLYKLRLPSLARGQRKMMSFFGEQSWQTTNMFPLFELVGPRQKTSTAGGNPGENIKNWISDVCYYNIM